VRHQHGHPNREILIVLSGGGHQNLGGRTYPARAGTMFLFDFMEPHDDGYPPHQPPAEHLWVVLIQDRCVAMLLEVGKGRRRYREKWRRLFSLQDLGLGSTDVLFGEGAASALPPAVRRARIAAGVALLAAALVAKGYAPTVAGSSTFRDEVIDTIQRHIREANGKACRLDNLARIAGYSKYHFLRLFRAHAGLTLGQYVDRCRRDAYRRMVSEGLRQKAIAEALGFAHPSALTRWRKRHVG
jgi:AraC-like DNA-binding protein